MASLTTKQYADLHGVSTSTVRRWISEFLIYAELVNGRYSIPEDEPPPPFEDEFTERSDFVTDDFGSQDIPDEPDDGPLILHEDDIPDEPEEEEPEEEDVEEDCEDETTKERKDLRRFFISREQAEDWASDIPVPTRVFKRCSDGRFQVEIIY